MGSLEFKSSKVFAQRSFDGISPAIGFGEGRGEVINADFHFVGGASVGICLE